MQVAQAPAATALVCGERTVTVAELDHLATRVTRSLLARSIGPGTLVGICLERSVEMVAAILGVIKTGAAYIPLDAEYPESRRVQILDEAQPPVVISVSSLWPKLPSPVSWLFWEDLEDGLDPSPQGVPACVGPRDPAYVIFTSGSTGRPKGVVVRQAELAVYLDWAGHRYLATGGQGAPLNTSIAFDATITSLFLPLLAGRPLWLVPQEEEIACLADLLSSGVPFDLVKLTPSHLDALRHQLGPRLGNVRVRRFVVGGEALRRDVVAPWREAVPGLEILNEYGPTETVVGCCLQSCHDDTGRGREIPIGHPTPGTRLYLLDARLRPVAEGETGELYIGGDQVAWGYLNRPAQTAERFLADPFSSIPGTRMYRTGDLARQDDRGRLEFLGRTDDQVKIRGHRIELGEIESCLLRQPGVAQAAVAVHEEAHLGQLLVGYVVCVAGMDVDPAVLTTALSRSLPPAWIPGFLLKLPALPLTPHGKLDRKALPLPNRKTGDGPAARTPVEQILSGLYAELLGLPVVGVHDNFFALGGHSLLAMRLVSSLRRDLSLEVPLRAIFEHPTVAGLAAWIGSQTGVAAVARPRIQREHRPARPPLSSAQQRLWFLQQLQQVQDTYHIPLAHRLRGTLDIDALRSAVRDLLERHESLRTLFPSAADGPWQQICDVAAQPLPLQLERVTDEELPERLASASREVFDLSSDLPVRFRVYQLAPDEHVLLVVFHHIAIDGASQGPFWRDLGVAYAARLSGRSPGWDRLPVQYVDYTLWQQRWLGQAGDPGSVMSRELDFWKQTLEGLPDELVLPTDRPRPTDGTFRGGRVPLVVPPGLHRQLLDLAHREQASLFMVLQGALAVLLSRLGAGTDIPLGSPIAGRLDELLQDQVGFFVNTLVLRTDLSGTPTFREVVRRVREFDLAAFAHQELPFEQLVQALQPQRSLARHPLFQVVLVLQSGLECVQDWPGLTATVEPVPHTTAKFDLLWELEATAKEGLQGVLEYSSALFDRESAERLVRRYFRVLEQCVASPDDCVCDIDVLEPGEKFSGGAAPDISEPAVARKSLGDCFEAVASSCHDRGAITCGFDQVTYDELNR
ncbi:MAG TPA: non-ribosomal peptide synthetase, partial [Planctomycetaceae bacterium]|nr:non-ribosomal peptide synthetase [Planctomycetaceae bacterium]